MKNILIPIVALLLLSCGNAQPKPKQEAEFVNPYKEAIDSIESRRAEAMIESDFSKQYADSSYVAQDSIAIDTWRKFTELCDKNELYLATWLCINNRDQFMMYCKVTDNVYAFYKNIAFKLYEEYLSKQRYEENVISILEIMFLSTREVMALGQMQKGYIPPHYYNLTFDLVCAYVKKEDYYQAEQLSELYVEDAGVLYGTDSYMYAGALLLKSYVNEVQYKWDKAKDIIEQAISIIDNIYKNPIEIGYDIIESDEYLKELNININDIYNSAQERLEIINRQIEEYDSLLNKR